MSPPSVCFLSSTVYEVPLDPTSEKKFRALAALGRIFVIGIRPIGRAGDTIKAPTSFCCRVRRDRCCAILPPSVSVPSSRWASSCIDGWGS